MPIDPLEELLTERGVDVIKILDFGWITVFNAPGINVVPEVELIHIHWDLTQSFALFVSLTLIFSITHQVAGIIIEDCADIMWST